MGAVDFINFFVYVFVFSNAIILNDVFITIFPYVDSSLHHRLVSAYQVQDNQCSQDIHHLHILWFYLVSHHRR